MDYHRSSHPAEAASSEGVESASSGLLTHAEERGDAVVVNGAVVDCRSFVAFSIRFCRLADKWTDSRGVVGNVVSWIAQCE